MNKKLFVMAALLLMGCASLGPSDHVRFVSFEEPEQTWPTRPWGLVHVVDNFPIYGEDQLPPAPYQVLGFVFVNSDPGGSLVDAERAMLPKAREQGGDAAIEVRKHQAASRLDVGEAEYLILQFKTNALASVLDRIQVYMALRPARSGTNGALSEPNSADLQALREAISRQSPGRSSP